MPSKVAAIVIAVTTIAVVGFVLTQPSVERKKEEEDDISTELQLQANSNTKEESRDRAAGVGATDAGMVISDTFYDAKTDKPKQQLDEKATQPAEDSSKDQPNFSADDFKTTEKTVVPLESRPSVKDAVKLWEKSAGEKTSKVPVKSKTSEAAVVDVEGANVKSAEPTKEAFPTTSDQASTSNKANGASDAKKMETTEPPKETAAEIVKEPQTESTKIIEEVKSEQPKVEAESPTEQADASETVSHGKVDPVLPVDEKDKPAINTQVDENDGAKSNEAAGAQQTTESPNKKRRNKKKTGASGAASPAAATSSGDADGPDVAAIMRAKAAAKKKGKSPAAKNNAAAVAAREMKSAPTAGKKKKKKNRN